MPPEAATSSSPGRSSRSRSTRSPSQSFPAIERWLQHGLVPCIAGAAIGARGDLGRPSIASAMRGHAILIGHGRVGGTITPVLDREALPYLVVERDRRRFEALRAQGVPVVFGDASAPGVLEQAGVAAARLLIVATPDSFLPDGQWRLRAGATPASTSSSHTVTRNYYACGPSILEASSWASRSWHAQCCITHFATSACPQSEHGCSSKTCPALNSRRERSDGSGYERFAGGGLIRASIRGHHVASLTADRMERVMGTTYAAGLNMRQQCPLPEIGRWSARGRSWPLADLVPVRYPARQDDLPEVRFRPKRTFLIVVR